MFTKIFRLGHKKQAKKVHVSDSDDDSWLESFHRTERGLPSLEKSQIRLLVYKDHDKRGDKLVLFDSKTDVQSDIEQNDEDNHKPARKRISSDVQMFGEMIFGSVEMTYKGPTVKVHSIRTPPQLLLTNVFALKPPRASHHGGSPTSNPSSEYSSSVRFSESISSISSVASPVLSSDNEDSSVVAKSVPVSSHFIPPPRLIQLQNIAEGFTNSISVDASRSLTFPRMRSASSSYQRRFLRSQLTRMDYGCMRRNESFNEEMSVRLRRRPKIGIGILFSLWEGKGTSEENNRLFQNFVFSHFPLFESHIHCLKRMVEKALLSSVQMSGKSFQDALNMAANTFACNILNLYYAPRIRDPIWLTMLSKPDQCNSICDDFVPQIVNAVEMYNTKQTNYFLSSLLTAVLTYHVAWVTTVMPSSEQARRAYLDKHSSETLHLLGESNPYNPLWAQLSELYGACGDPTKMTRTVILGRDQHIVAVLLNILSYFIRCSEVFERQLEQAPKNLSTCLDHSPTELVFDEENKGEGSKWDTISEKSEKFDRGKNLNSAKDCNNLSQNSKSFIRDSKLGDERVSSTSANLCKKAQRLKDSNCSSNSLNCNEKQAKCLDSKDTKIVVEKFDSFSVEDSGICSTDFETSVEISSNIEDDFVDCTMSPKNESRSENSQHSVFEDCSHNSDLQVCKNSRIPENSDKDFKNTSHVSTNCRFEKTEESRKDLVENCELQDFNNEKSKNIVQKKPSSICECSKDKLCEQCENLRKSDDIILKSNAEICNCSAVFNSKEHKLWKTFLRTSCCNKNTRSFERRCFSDDNMKTKFARRCSSEKAADMHKLTKLCVQNDGKILSLDRESILDMFLSSYPLCPVCKGQLSFVDHELEISDTGVKSCSCQVVDSDVGENGRCVSSMTVGSDGYHSAISLQSLEAERCSISSLDSGLNEPCLQSKENVVKKSATEEQIFALELPDAHLDENDADDDMSNKKYVFWTSQDCQLFSFGRSLMAGYCDQYVPDFVLHGTERCTEEQAKQSLQVSLEQPVVDSPVSESVIIIGDTEKWECNIKTLSKQRKSTGILQNGVRCKKADRSTLVHDFLTSFCDLWKLNMPATFCLMHLEDKMKELYLRSKVVSEYLLTQKKYITMRELMSTFGYGECDLALILSIIGVHSPLVLSRLPLC